MAAMGFDPDDPEEVVGRMLVEAFLRGRATWPPTNGSPFARICRVCGCTDMNACIDEAGRGCGWVDRDLCSACAPFTAAQAASRPEGGHPMEKITDWEAQRSGAGLTVQGKDRNGQPRRFTGVDKIVRGSTGVVARNKDGGAVVELA